MDNLPNTGDCGKATGFLLKFDLTFHVNYRFNELLSVFVFIQRLLFSVNCVLMTENRESLKIAAPFKQRNLMECRQ